MARRPVALSKAVAHALRHQPWLYELELDEEGWAPLADLVEALRERSPRWRGLTRDDLVRMVEDQTKVRYEISRGYIRALYGHTVPGGIVKEPVTPPEVLFHGTAPEAAPAILADGLSPMARQYVHLSADRDTAYQVGRRKSAVPAILLVTASGAHSAGVPFWRGNAYVWLTDYVPPQYLYKL